MLLKDADGRNCKPCRPWLDCSLIWVCTVCPGLSSVWKLRIVTVIVVCNWSVFPKGNLLYPQQNGVLVGYTVFSMSVIPKFRQHLMILLSNFDSFCPILFKFTHHHNHQTMPVWQKNRGWRVSITRVMPLCNSYNKMFVLWLIVIPSAF